MLFRSAAAAADPPAPAPASDAPAAAAAPAAAPKKGKKGVSNKPIEAEMAEDIIPMLRTRLEVAGATGLTLAYKDGALAGAYTNGSIPVNFWAYFPEGKLSGQRGFAVATHGQAPSTLEPFIIDEKARRRGGRARAGARGNCAGFASGRGRPTGRLFIPVFVLPLSSHPAGHLQGAGGLLYQQEALYAEELIATGQLNGGEGGHYSRSLELGLAKLFLMTQCRIGPSPNNR